MQKQTIYSWTWQDAYGYSQGVLVVEPRQTLYAAEQGPVDSEGNLVHEGDVAAQTRHAMDNVVPAGGIATEVAALAIPGMLVEVTVIACS